MITRLRSITLRAGASGLFSLLALGCGSSDPSPNVVLITVDTLRADYIHAYGFPAAVTPHIDALAARGVLFETGVAAATSTVPAHASIMTGLYGRQHSVGLHNGSTRLANSETLAQRFRDAGYATGAFVGNVVLKRRVGLDRGFDHYDDQLPASESNRPALFERIAQQGTERALAWLEQNLDGPFFLWMHYQDPHGPYLPPPPYDDLGVKPVLRTDRPLSFLKVDRARAGIPAYQRLGELRLPSEYASRYAGEIAYTDAWIGRLLGAVDAQSESGGRSVVILFTADHGESLGEGGFFFQHGHATTPELAGVPFILAAPGLAPGRRSEPVSHVDVAPTLLELAGLPPLEAARGTSLVPVARGRALADRLLFCETPGETTAYGVDFYTSVRGWKTDAAGVPDIERALAEDSLRWRRAVRRRDGSWRVAPVEETHRSEIIRYLEHVASTVPAAAMSEDDVARLRALGYLSPEPDDVSRNEDSTAPPFADPD